MAELDLENLAVGGYLPDTKFHFNQLNHLEWCGFRFCWFFLESETSSGITKEINKRGRCKQSLKQQNDGCETADVNKACCSIQMLFPNSFNSLIRIRICDVPWGKKDVCKM